MADFSKKTLRRKTRERRNTLSSSERSKNDALIKRRLFNIQEFKEANTVCFYVSFRTEVDTIRMIEETLKIGKRVLVPKVDTERRQLRLYEIKEIGELSPGHMGIPEPSLPDERLRNINDASLFVIPGVGFDLSGNRLGYGAGYYDMLLSAMEKKVPLIALAYKEQLLASIPSEPHDVKVDIIVTEEGTIKIE